MRVAVTGARGRLGGALMRALGDAAFSGPGGPIGWSRPEFDLDAPDRAVELLRRDRPDVVVHAAAWTDVDGCARDPAAAMRRNAGATGVVAAACARAGVDLVVISTNEVFDGRRTDGRGYRTDDPTAPINPYGASKLEGEERAQRAFAGRSAGGPELAIVRTAWLFGPPGSDFPAKIVAAAIRASAAGEALRVVGDEVGSPSYAPDVADAIVEFLAAGTFHGVHHVVNPGIASRADWARAIIRLTGLDTKVEEVPAASWERASTPPRWAVLAPSPLPSGESLRPWSDALADEAARLRQAVRDAAAAGSPA